MKINDIIKQYKRQELDINDAMELSLPYVKWAVKKFMGRYDEDTLQEANIVLFNCFNTYENEVEFSTYVFNHIKWHLVRFIRRSSIIRKPEYLYYNGNNPDKDIIVIPSHTKANSRDRDNDVFLIDVYKHENSLVEKSDDYFMLHELSKDIASDKMNMIKLWLDGYTFKEIGEVYNISHEWASVNIKKSIKIMQNKAVKLGYLKETIKPIKVSDPRVVKDVVNKNGTLSEIALRYGLTELQLKGLIKRLTEKGMMI